MDILSLFYRGGKESDTDVPYQCSLESSGHYCGCAIISEVKFSLERNES